jgi:HD-like signal output (HDOD) protein
VSENTDLGRLELLFRRSGTLPALPSTAVQLLKTLDSGEASASDLEHIIAADPALSAEFLRMASMAAAGGVPRYSTIRSAIMLLGQRTVRSLATSLLLRHLTFGSAKTPHFDAARFSRHSLGIAILARFLFARKQMKERVASDWSVDEVFAAGLLSSLGLGLLSKVAPETYDRIYMHAKRTGLTVEGAFQRLFGKPSTTLTAAAVEVWGLPAIFSSSLVHLYQPWAFQDEFAALCCLNYAVALSDTHGLAIGDWEVPFEVEPEVELEVGLVEEERDQLMQAVQHHIDEWVHSGKRAA